MEDPRADRGADPSGSPYRTVRGEAGPSAYGLGHGYGEQTPRC